MKASAQDRYFRLVNYLAAAQVYLKDNVLLEKPLKPEHIKERLLGHWGTCPGINYIYLHLNQIIQRTSANMLLLTGPGHGAAANLANIYVEGTLTEFYPELTRDRAGLHKFVCAFSRPGGFPSHLNPALPGVIHEGGELGYALATAYGAVLDNPDLIAACIVGDGEAETGPTATAWHSNKFLNPKTDGAVLPILHLNGFKISSPTVFGTMNNEELELLFKGYGFGVRIVEPGDPADSEFEQVMDWAHGEILKIQKAARKRTAPERPPWPMLILRTPKGWTGPKTMDGKTVEGSFRSHQVPGKDLKHNPAHLRAVEQWLRSYKPAELFDAKGAPAPDITALCPKGDKRIAVNPHTFGGRIRKPLNLPALGKHSVEVKSPVRNGRVRWSSLGNIWLT